MDDKEEENPGSKKSLKRNFKMKGIIITIASLLAVYMILACFFCNHFYIGTKINDKPVSGKTVAAINDEMSGKVQNYKITLEERNNKSEDINAANLNISYNGSSEMQNIKDKQPGLTWLFHIFSNKNNYIDNLVSYNNEDLDKTIDALSCFKKENIEEPKNASFEYSDNQFKVIDAVKGCKIDKVLLKDTIVRAIEGMKDTINLESENCYIVPKYAAGDDKVNAAKDELNKYSGAQITYSQGDKTAVLDANTIHNWLTVNDEMEVTFDSSKVSDFLKTLQTKFNTVGESRHFKTTGGSEVTVSGGDYGWKIDKDKEKESIINSVKAGETVNREPIYAQKALTHDGNEIGNTYVEVSLSGQHLWFYKNGQLVTEGSVVTGNTSAGHGTPGGVYYVEYKETNATLRGDGYATPVSFWMPFNEGIGMHDANWRGSFGGSIYSYNGSHGCVNCPYSLAQTIFNNIDAGTPVVCY